MHSRNPFTRRSTVALAVVGAVALTGTTAYAAGSLSSHGGAARLDGDQTKSVRNAIEGGTSDNVILLIGDGMGDSEITSARYYQYGAAGRLPGIDALPLTGQYTTYSLTKDGKPDYVPDSAATGSARPAPRPTTTPCPSTSRARRRRPCSSWPRRVASRPAT